MACQTLWFKSTMTGAPAISGTAGVLVTALDAILVNGFPAITLSSLSVTAEVATATFSTTHTFPQWCVIDVAGATPAELNGRQRVLTITATQLTFAALGVPNGLATGTITVRIPPAGWTIEQTGTNLRWYRNNPVTGTGSYVYINDTVTTEARIIGYTSLAAADPFPTTAQISGGLYIRKSNLVNATARPWFALADDRGFYLGVLIDGVSSSMDGYFGDINSFSSPPFPYDCLNAFQSSSSVSSNLGTLSGAAGASVPAYLARLRNEVPGAVNGSKRGFQTSSSPVGAPYPSTAVGGVFASDRVLVFEGVSTGTHCRGQFPGFVEMVNLISSVATHHGLLTITGLAEPVLTSLSGTWIGIKLGDWR